LIPVLIHWIGSRLREKVPFPWIKLLLLTEKEGRKWRRIYDILLLIIRTAVISLLVLSFSGPVVKQKLPKINEIYIDVSESMRKNSVIEEGWNSLKSRFPNAKIYGIARGFKRELGEIKWTHRSTDFTPLRDSRGNIMLISDMQRTGMREEISLRRDLYILRMNLSKENVAITSVETELPYLIPGSPTTLKIHLANYGNYLSERRVTVKGGKVSRDATIQLKPGERKVLEVTLNLDTPTYKIELTPKDSLEGDDYWFGVLPLIKEKRILLLGSSENTRYLREALSPKGTKLPFKVEVKEELRSSWALNGYSEVGLLKVPTKKEIAILTEYINRGGKLVAFFGNEKDNPLLNVLRVKAKRVGGTVRLSRMVELESDLLSEVSVEKPIVFEDGSPFLWGPGPLGVTLKRWKVVLVGFIPSPQFSDIPFSPLMVPFSHRLFLILFEGTSGIQYRVGEKPIVPVSKVGRYTLLTPLGEKISILSRVNKGLPSLELPPLEELGFYNLSGEKEEKIFAVNQAIDESDITPLGDEEIKRMAKNVHFLPNDVLNPTLNLTNLLLFLVLTLLGIEILLISKK